jgi:hypothetical protein
MNPAEGQSSGPQAAGPNKKLLVIGAAAIGLLAVAAVLAFIFWPKPGQEKMLGTPAAPAGAFQIQPQAQPTALPASSNQPTSLSPVKAQPPAGAAGPFVPTEIPAGIDRPLTVDEKRARGFIVTDDIWMKTTKPANGGKPQASFYNKTVPATPRPPDSVSEEGDSH